MQEPGVTFYKWNTVAICNICKIDGHHITETIYSYVSMQGFFSLKGVLLFEKNILNIQPYFDIVIAQGLAKFGT